MDLLGLGDDEEPEPDPTPEPNVAPTAVIGGYQSIGYINTTMVFDGSQSSDPNADDVLTYVWTFGDGTTSDSGAVVQHVYTQMDFYTVSLKVTDSEWIPYDDYYFTPEYSYVRLETIDAYGLAALDLLADVVRRPRFTAEALAQAKEGAIARARS